MKRKPADSLFKPTLSRAESKNDVTSRTARGIIDSEAAAMAAKTERLRAARLAAEAAAPPPPPRKARRGQSGT